MRILRQKQYWLDHWNDDKYKVIREKITSTFNDLIFDEEPHKYYLHGVELPCVSHVVSSFEPKFDAVAKASQMVMKYYNNKTSKYYQKSKQEILDEWKANNLRATTEGSRFHEFGESCFYYMLGRYDEILPSFKDRLIDDEEGKGFKAIEGKEEAIVEFWESVPDFYMPMLAEAKMFRVDLNYAGTMDILFMNDTQIPGNPTKEDGLLIFDYKTNGDLYKCYGDKLLTPFEDLDKKDLNVYKIQLSLYENCLSYIGFNILGRRLVWLKPDGHHEKVRLESYAKKLESWILEHPVA